MIQKSHLTIVALFILAGTLLAACGDGEDVPPTEIRVVTSTPTSESIAVGDTNAQATLDAMIERQDALQATIDAQATLLVNEEATNNANATGAPNATLAPTATINAPEATPTDLPSVFPTPRVEQVIAVEQVFEKGRMFWLRDRRQVWVVVGDEVDPNRGTWLCFEDSFQEGDIESLEELEPEADATTDSTFPDAVIQQPIRGFGKVWREEEGLREDLGWALTGEIEHNTERRYIAGGLVNADDVYEAGAGEWRLFSFYGGTFVFLESELGMACPSGTWRYRP